MNSKNTKLTDKKNGMITHLHMEEKQAVLKYAREQIAKISKWFVENPDTWESDLFDAIDRHQYLRKRFADINYNI